LNIEYRMNQQELINLLPPEIQKKIYYYTLPILNSVLQNEIINYKRKPKVEVEIIYINYNFMNYMRPRLVFSI
jgi:hypothetical protein